MTALSTTEGYAATPSDLTLPSKPAVLSAVAHPNMNAETNDMLSILGRTLFLLGLGTIALVAVTGKLPLFFVPLGLFLFFGGALQWRQSRPADESATRLKCGTSAMS